MRRPPTAALVAVAALVLVLGAATALLLSRDGTDGVAAGPSPSLSGLESGSARPTATGSPTPSATVSGSTVASGEATPTSAPTATPREPNGVLVGAGDIGSCDSQGDEATAALLDGIEGTVVTLGDNAYTSGTAAQYRDCYGPSWGRHVSRTRPTPGNHEYETFGAAAYFAYFGLAAGPPGLGWYSYDVGGWHIIALNSTCDAIGGCDAGSAQERWLRADLAAHPATCTLAYWHHPRFSSEVARPSDPRYDAFWRALYEADADVVLVGHAHVYERFEPQTPDAVADPERGIRQFTVGTGGHSLREFGAPVANSEVRGNSSFGVLRLNLYDDAYEWSFIPATGNFTDSGSGACH